MHLETFAPIMLESSLMLKKHPLGKSTPIAQGVSNKDQFDLYLLQQIYKADIWRLRRNQENLNLYLRRDKQT